MTIEASPTKIRLCLYVAGDWPNSKRAIANLKALLVGFDHEIEIVDCLDDPGRGMRDGIFYTPTLVRYSPTPRRTVIGDLSDRAKVLDLLMRPA